MILDHKNCFFFPNRGIRFINTNTKLFLTLKFIERWMSIRLNLVVALFGGCVGICAVILRDRVDASLAGLVEKSKNFNYLKPMNEKNFWQI